MSLAGQQTRRNNDSALGGRMRPTDTRPGAPKGSAQSKMPPLKTWLWFVVVLLANFLLGSLLMPGPEAPVTVPYTLFKEEVGKTQCAGDFQPGRDHHGPF